jgi:hypothetical protein
VDLLAVPPAPGARGRLAALAWVLSHGGPRRPGRIASWPHRLVLEGKNDLSILTDMPGRLEKQAMTYPYVHYILG